MKKKIVCAILVLLFGSVIAISAYQVYTIFHEYEEGQSAYEDLSEYVELPDEPAVPETPDIPTVTEPGPGETQKQVSWPQADFEALHEVNSDIVGWIYLEGSEINYPIAQSEDNSYYLKHLFDKSSNSSGCVLLGNEFLYRCCFQNMSLI